MHNDPIAAALASVTLGPEVLVKNLTMLPLLSRGPRSAADLDYLVLDDALASGIVEITEVSEQGSVPDLKVMNFGTKPLLIIDGEELVGAKQNRVINLTVLVAAHTEMTIPVSCVEAGRWRSRSRAFTSAPRTQYASGRAKRMAQVSFSMMSSGERLADQAEIWADIAAKSSRLDARSETSAMEALFTDHAVSIDAFVAGCQPIDGQVGALFAVDGVIVGFDLFDRPSTLRKVLPKLVRSVAVEAIDATAAEPISDAPMGKSRGFRLQAEGTLRARGAQLLAVSAQAPQHPAKALGLGQDLRLSAPHLAGAALVVDHHVVHLGAFAV